MIPTNNILNICKEYNVGDYISIKKIPKGVLNDNYLLETTKGKYFIKSVREESKNRLKNIYSVESLMKDSGAKAVTMLETTSGEIFVSDEKHVYTLYPFLEADGTEKYSSEDYKNMGKMLAKIHLVGNGDEAIKIPNTKQFKRPPDDVILERLKTYKNLILNKDKKDEIDENFLKYINFKLAQYPKVTFTELPNDTLIHGDYHPGNILMNTETREIIGVCDWEKVEFAPRAYELARSLLYSCFSHDYKYEKALSDSKFFLEGYLCIYPMTQKEIMDGLKMRTHRMILSSWIEEKYYKNNDSRANHFVEHEKNLIEIIVNGDLLEEIGKMISEK